MASHAIIPTTDAKENQETEIESLLREHREQRDELLAALDSLLAHEDMEYFRMEHPEIDELATLAEAAILKARGK